jgi:hypothetical protein
MIERKNIAENEDSPCCFLSKMLVRLLLPKRMKITSTAEFHDNAVELISLEISI